MRNMAVETIVVDSFMEVADFLNENPKKCAELKVNSGDSTVLVFVSIKNRLTVRDASSFSLWVDDDVTRGNIEESDVENLVYEIVDMM